MMSNQKYVLTVDTSLLLPHRYELLVGGKLDQQHKQSIPDVYTQ